MVCLLSKEWESSVECLTEYRTAETLNKRVFCARLEPDTGKKTSAWQWCDLFGDGPTTAINIGDGHPVLFATQGLYRLRDGIVARASAPTPSSGPSTSRPGRPTGVGSHSIRPMPGYSLAAMLRLCAP